MVLEWKQIRFFPEILILPGEVSKSRFLGIFTLPGGAFWGWSLIQDPESLLVELGFGVWGKADSIFPRNYKIKEWEIGKKAIFAIFLHLGVITTPVAPLESKSGAWLFPTSLPECSG